MPTGLDRRWFVIIVTLLGIAIAAITVHLFDTLERMAMCSQDPSPQTCCEHGECTYKPASDEMRPAR